MAKRIFITATNTDIGKTYLTKLLMRAFTDKGYSVGVVKPIETGVTDEMYPDGDELLGLLKQLNPLAWSLDVEDIVPISYELPAAPAIASNFSLIDYDKIDRAIAQQEAFCDVLLIEGAGGLYVPLDSNAMMIDLIKALQATALLVTHCSLGCINDTLLSQKTLEDKKVSFATVFNCKEDDESFSVVSEPYFLAKDLKVYKSASDIDTLCDVLYNL
ncbi:dethiobiotin synthase [Sulfurimonas paralvinellae]|uniref:ATP-dependent dethiobiotin synthetase BioD n=1 Tax=Sulfurimonas paralvinellae TaxID=317658 RepID=A0A7M1B936_9BACT|nr:dethiobiotin synthase [Sulfurimonas paralvinellae]QOP46224.1 dethiobiotin synthase [Sulfurimonas paralvinellae]